jgi:hypothetical protein
MQLKALTHHIFRQVGREVARRNAEAQHREADRAPPARARLSVTYQAVCKIRVRFVERG